MNVFKDLTGNKFGKLIVIKECGFKTFPSGKKIKLWECLCECGNSKNILGTSLKSGNTISCGCEQKIRTSKARRCDLTGKRFGKLIAKEYSHCDKKNRSYWKCVCDCGSEKTINTASLKSGRSKSCGCRQGNYTHGMWGKPGYKAVYLKDPIKKVKHSVGVAIRQALKSTGGCKKNECVFDYLPYTAEELKLHLESQFQDWMNWENYGGKNSDKKRSWHIDHIKPQSLFFYTSMKDQQFLDCWSLDNLRPLDKIENIKKGTSLL